MYSFGSSPHRPHQGWTGWCYFICIAALLIGWPSSIGAQPTTATFIMKYTMPGAKYEDANPSDMCWVNENTLVGTQTRGELVWKLNVNLTSSSLTYHVLDCATRMVGVSCLWNKTFYATSQLLDHIRVFDFSPGGVEAMSRWYPTGLSSVPDNIAVNEDKIIIAEQIPSALKEFDHSGVYQGPRSIDGANYWSHGTDTTQGTYMHLTTDGYLLVARQGVHNVWIYNTATSSVVKIGSYGSGAGQFDEPSGIQDTPDNYILVADKDNDRVCTIAKDGTYVNTLSIVGDSLSTPSALAVGTQDGKTVLALVSEEVIKFYELT